METITITTALGGFIVTYPKRLADGTIDYPTEITTSVGKTMRVVKQAVEAFSQIAKPEKTED